MPFMISLATLNNELLIVHTVKKANLMYKHYKNHCTLHRCDDTLLTVVCAKSAKSDL